MSTAKIEVLLEPYRVDLFKPFRISRDAYESKIGVRVILKMDNQIGLGEANEHAYYQVTQKELFSQLEEVKNVIEGQPLLHPVEIYQLAERAIGFQPFALAAIDIAYWDLYAKCHNQPTRALLELTLPDHQSQFSSYTISIDKLSGMKKEVRLHPFEIYKVKLGTEDDIHLMQCLLDITDSNFYIDVNCAWDSKYAQRFVEVFKDSRIVMIEQPMKADAWEEMEHLKAQCDIPFIADESFIHLSDLERCAYSFNGINIKLLKCGGITPAVEIIKAAQAKGMDIMVGCMMESHIGICAAMQITPWANYIDIDSAIFLKNDSSSGSEISSNGSFSPPIGIGNGSTLKRYKNEYPG